MAPSPAQTRKRPWLRLLLLLPVILILAFGGFVIVGNARNPLMPAAEAALQSSAEVEFEDQGWLIFKPTAVKPITGLIIYPGGFVPPAAYAPLAQNIAAAGYIVVITPMPLNLAVLDASEATDIIAAFPDIQHWAIGGHSLGGAMAANFTATNPHAIAGLLLWAAYPAAGDDLSNYQGAVTTIYGTADGLAQLTDIDNARPLLPDQTIYAPIEGGNHTQFGYYGTGLQSGDDPASISRDEQQQQILENTLNLLLTIEN